MAFYWALHLVSRWLHEQSFGPLQLGWLPKLSKITAVPTHTFSFSFCSHPKTFPSPYYVLHSIIQNAHYNYIKLQFDIFDVIYIFNINIHVYGIILCFPFLSIWLWSSPAQICRMRRGSFAEQSGLCYPCYIDPITLQCSNHKARAAGQKFPLPHPHLSKCSPFSN